MEKRDVLESVVEEKEMQEIKRRAKKDYSAMCNLNDQDESNDCWGCTRFCFPIGCMVGE